MEEYKPNSHKFKEEQAGATAPDKKIEKVISGSAKSRKKGGLQKFVEGFVQEDGATLGDIILKDVVVPLVKKGIDDAVHTILYGAGSSKRNAPGSNVSYQPYYNQGANRRNYASPVVARNAYNFDDVWLDTRGDAELVLNSMCDLIMCYGFVCVADLYELVGMRSNYTDNKYGWTDLRDAEIIRSRDGYTFRFPKVVPLN